MVAEPAPRAPAPAAAPQPTRTAAVDYAPAGEAMAEPGNAEPSAADGEPPSWPDENAEAAFLGEARDRGETVVPKPALRDAEEHEPKALPKLDDLVNRIPPDVRDVLEELFRAKFVKVQRVPKRVLKT